MIYLIIIEINPQGNSKMRKSTKKEKPTAESLAKKVSMFETIIKQSKVMTEEEQDNLIYSLNYIMFIIIKYTTLKTKDW